MSVPISQFTPSPFPPWYPYICFLCLSLYFCFVDKIICTKFFFRFYMYVLMHYICFSFSDLLQLCMTVSRSIHVLTKDPILFHFITNILLTMYTTSSLFIPLLDIQIASTWTARRSNQSFHVLTTVNHAVKNIGVHVSI